VHVPRVTHDWDDPVTQHTEPVAQSAWRAQLIGTPGQVVCETQPKWYEFDAAEKTAQQVCVD
jgi:hypothetical protein